MSTFRVWTCRVRLTSCRVRGAASATPTGEQSAGSKRAAEARRAGFVVRYRVLEDSEAGDVVRIVFETRAGKLQWFGMGRIMFGQVGEGSLETVALSHLDVGEGSWVLSEIREHSGLTADDEDLPDRLLAMLFPEGHSEKPRDHYGREHAQRVNAEQWEAFSALLDRPARDVPALRRLLSEPTVLDG